MYQDLSRFNPSLSLSLSLFLSLSLSLFLSSNLPLFSLSLYLHYFFISINISLSFSLSSTHPLVPPFSPFISPPFVLSIPFLHHQRSFLSRVFHYPHSVPQKPLSDFSLANTREVLMTCLCVPSP